MQPQTHMPQHSNSVYLWTNFMTFEDTHMHSNVPYVATYQSAYGCVYVCVCLHAWVCVFVLEQI